MGLIEIWTKLHYWLLTLRADVIPSAQLHVRENRIKIRGYVKRKKISKGKMLKFKMFYSTEVCHTVYRSSTLALSFAHPQRYREQLWLPCYLLWTSWGKLELHHSACVWYQVGTTYPLFVNWSLKPLNRYNV